MRIPVPVRRIAVPLLHAVLCAGAYYAAYVLRLDDVTLVYGGIDYMPHFTRTLALAVGLRLAALQVFGLNRGIWRYASTNDLLRLAYAVAASSIALGALSTLAYGMRYVPHRVLVIDAALCMLFLGGVRFVRRVVGEHRRPAPGGPRTVIVGAGDAGETVVRELRRVGHSVPVAFVDDDPAKRGRTIHGVPVRGGVDALGAVIAETGATEVVIAVPSRGPEVVERAFAAAGGAGARFRVVAPEPGPVRLPALRRLDVADLIARPVHDLDEDRIRADVAGKRVLVTGGAGSIGAELVRRVLRYGPESATVVDRDENALHYLLDALAAEGLASRDGTGRLRVRVADVSDRPSVARVLEEARPHYVLHAAAYKHVPLMETNPLAAIRNNVGATRTCLAEADRLGTVEKFLLVSSDKAVRPSSVMGATKRASELALFAAPAGRAARVAVRFGNVAGSAGSVVPLFTRQIERGGPVTLTHRDATRYFMTIPEAVGLVLQAAAMARGGEVFHLDMGKPVRIEDVARRMIELAGYVPGRDVEILEIGLRPGEKLHEELLAAGETVEPTAHPRVRLATGAAGDPARLASLLDALEEAAARAEGRAALLALALLVAAIAPTNEEIRKAIAP